MATYVTLKTVPALPASDLPDNAVLVTGGVLKQKDATSIDIDNVQDSPTFVKADVKANASDGKTAHTETAVYRSDVPPTNNPTPSSISHTTNTDGSVNITVSWGAYTHGAKKANALILFWKSGSSSGLGAPTEDSEAVSFNVNTAQASSFTLEGVAADKYYSFGLAAVAYTESGHQLGTIQSTAASPQWQDYQPSAVVNFTGKIDGTDATTVKTNAADGKTAHTETAVYRSDVAPTNNPTPTGVSHTVNEDGSVNITVSWDAYTQGAKKANALLLFWKSGISSGLGAPTEDSDAVSFNVNTTLGSSYTLEGVPANKYYSFGLAAVAYTESGHKLGAIQSPTAAPKWQDYQPETAVNFTGSIDGTAATTVKGGAVRANAGLDAAGTVAQSVPLAHAVANVPAIDTTTGKVDPAIPNSDGSSQITDSGGTINGNLTITGNLVVQGDQIIANTATVQIEDNLLVINNGELGAGVTAGIAGIEVDRGTSTNYQFIFQESDDSFRIGQVGGLQSVATREDAPNDKSIAFWNNTAYQFQTDTNLVWDSATGRLGIGTSTPTAALNAEGGVVFNDSGADADFRVESQANANLLVVDGQGAGRIGFGAAASAQSKYLFSGSIDSTWSTGTLYGVSVNASITPAANASAYVAHVGGTLVEAATGTHAMMAGLYVQAPTITSGLATLTNAASVYIDAAPTATTTGGTYSLYAAAGLTRLDGGLSLGTSTNSETLHLGGSNPRIYLGDSVAPGTTTNRLYSINGVLYWDGINLSGTALPTPTEGYTIRGTSTVWQATSDLFITSTGEVGIGTTAPTKKLEVAFSSDTVGLRITRSDVAGDSKLIFANSSGDKVNLGYSSNGYLDIHSGKLVVLDTGNIGIGTATPGAKLAFDDITGEKIEFHSSGGGYSIGVQTSELRISTGGFMSLYTGGYGGTERVRMDSSGKVIIGGTSADGTNVFFEVINSSGDSEIAIKSADGSDASIIFGDATDFSRGKIKYTSADNMYFQVNNLITALTLDSNSNAIVGNTTAGLSSKLLLYSGVGDGATYDTILSLSRLSSTGNRLVGKIVLDDKSTNFGNLVFRVKTTASSAENAAYYTDALTIDGENGNVGIGTAPSHKLHIAGGDISIDNSKYYRAKDSGGTARSILYLDSSNVLTLQNNALGTGGAINLFSGATNTNGIYINTSGNVGIGTTSINTSTALEVSRSGATNAFIGISQPGTGNAYIRFDASNGDFTGSDYAWIGQNNDLSSVWQTDTSAGDIYIMPKGGSGYVGIGTTTPSTSLGGTALHIVNTGDQFPIARLERTGGTTKTNNWWEILVGSAGAFAIRDGNTSTQPFEIEMGANANSLYVTSSGSVGIGTATPSGVFEVQGSTTTHLVKLLNTNAAGYSGLDIYNENGTLAGSLWLAGSTAGASNNRNAITLASRVSGEKIYIVAGGYDPTTDGGITIDAGKVGIGVTSPAQALDVSGNIAISAGKSIYLNGSSDANWRISKTTSHDVIFYGAGATTRRWKFVDVNGSVDRFWIEMVTGNAYFQGDVGIGTTAPGYKLEVSGSISSYSDGSVMRLRSTDYIIGQIEARGTSLDYDKGLFRLFDTGTATVYLDSAGDSYLTGGNLGIGTSTISERLHIGGTDPRVYLGDATAPGTTTNRLYSVSGVLYWNGINLSGEGSGTLPTASEGAILRGNGTIWSVTTDLFVKSDGSIGVGTTTPGSKVHILGTTAGESLLKVEGTNGVLFEVTDSVTGTLFAVNDGSGIPILQVDADDTVLMAPNSSTPLVGIGTTAPALALHIAYDDTGAYNQDDGQLILGGRTDTNKRLNIGFDTTNDQGFLQAGIKGTGYNNLLLNPNGGNVGIGTTGPNSKLTVVGGDLDLRETDNGNSAVKLSASTTKGAIDIYQSGTATVHLEGMSNGNSYFNTGGSVGIGVTSPATPLHVAGSSTVGIQYISSAHSYIKVDATTATYQAGYYIFKGGVQKWGIYTPASSDDLRFYGGADALTIKSTGEVGIGTTAPSNNLHIHYGTGNTAVIRLESSAANQNASIYYVSGAADRWELGTGISASSAFELYERTSGSTGSRLVVVSGGNVGIGTTAPTAHTLQVHNGTDGSIGSYTVQTRHVDGLTDTANWNYDTLYLQYSAAGKGVQIGDSGTDHPLTVYGSGYFASSVSIGTATASSTLHVYNDSVNGSIVTLLMLDTGTQSNITLGSGSIISFEATSNAVYGAIGGYGTGTYTGIGIWPATKSGTPSLYVSSNSSNVGIGTIAPGYKLEVNGSFAATSKSFVIKHPTKANAKLVHGSLEGPEHAVYYRGELKDDTAIKLPDYWRGLVDMKTVTVQLTPVGKYQRLYVKGFGDNKIYIGKAGLGSKVSCYFTVTGTRKDIDKLEVEVFA